MHANIKVSSDHEYRAEVSLPLLLSRIILLLFDLWQLSFLADHDFDVNRIREALSTISPGDVLDYQDENIGTACISPSSDKLPACVFYSVHSSTDYLQLSRCGAKRAGAAIGDQY